MQPPIAGLSNLHLGFDEFEPPRMGANVVVLVGDVDQGLRGLQATNVIAVGMGDKHHVQVGYFLLLQVSDYGWPC